jgi:hypothetical protein
MRVRLQKWGRCLVAGLLAIGALSAQPARAAVTFVPGDLFVGTVNGNIQHRSSSGALLETLNTTVGNAFDTGMCFDLAGNLYATDIGSQAITKFDSMGNLVAARWVDTSSDGNNPESCVWNAANTNAYVGGPSVPQIRQYALTGTEVTRSTVAASGGTGGTDWVDLSGDQCSVYYTNESATIRRFDTCTKTQLTDFATVDGGCFALRIRPTTKEVMVACSDGAHLLSSTGINEQTYPLGFLFALNLDPDGKSFWTAGPGGSTVLKVDIATGAVLLTIATGAPVWGLAVFGELTAASTTVTTSLSGGGQTGANITVAAGTAVHDSATLGGTNSPTAGGTVTYNVYSDNQCTVLVANGGTKTVTNGGVPDSVPVTLTAAGTYFWQATYSGDPKNNPSKSVCGAETETVTVTEGSISAQGTTFTATEGQPFTATVATFTDPDANATAAEYSATIDWGDGGSSVGTISPTSGGNFSVSGTHTYTEEGTDHVAVTITDTDNPSNSAMAKSTANVGDAALKASPACSSTSLLFYNGPTATFTDAASPFGTLTDFSATINWGDGTPVTAGTVTGPNGGPYAVSGSHTYATTGNFTITTTVKDVGGSMATTSCSTLGFSFAPGGGSFVIGDQNAVIGNSVTFWGAQWAKLNSLSGGKAPSSFKGFAEDPKNPACSLDWSADPGNSTPPPPGPLPAFMGVIVTSSTSKFGSTISGNTVHIVIVQTNPGYAPNPGHAGTGTVVAVVC